MTDLDRIERKLDLILSVLNIQHQDQDQPPRRDADRRATSLADFAAKQNRKHLRQRGN